MRRTRIYRMASLVMVFTAILGLALPASADDHPVPFRGLAVLVINSSVPAPDGLHLTVTGEGNATHLGRFTHAENAVVYPDGTIQSTVVWTAANGDELFFSDVAQFTSPTTAVGTYTVTGGTGRFGNASGTIDFQAVVASDGIHVAIAYKGTIRF
jgi:hypothetical protein